MQWDHLFEDLEGQLASEIEAERAALDAESERLRISKTELRERLRMLCAANATAGIALRDGTRMTARLRALGADWIAVEPLDVLGDGAAPAVVPLDSVVTLTLSHDLLLDSLAPVVPTPSLRERMTLGFVLRDLARRRAPVRLTVSDGSDLHGTIDRAAADHLDIALHDPGEVRRADAVLGFRVVPLRAIVLLRTSRDAQLP